MPTLTITASSVTEVDYWGASDESYASVHDANEGNAIWTDESAGRVGQAYLAPSGPYSHRYRVYRLGLKFDCGALPANAFITAAKIQLWPQSDSSTTDFEVTVVNGDDLDFPGVAADYGQLLDEVTSYGSWDTVNWPSPAAYIDINLNANGIAEITRLGITKFGLRSSRDINSDTPTGSELCWLGAISALILPKLVITYILADKGTLWQEGTKVHFIDENMAEQSHEGTFIAHHVTPQYKPHLWFQDFSTSFLLYIDEDNVDRRRLDGTATGVTGQPKGTLFVEGAHLHGIDVDGAEQYI